jgi:hypothetical protein
MNVYQRKKKIYGKEFIFTVKNQQVEKPVYRQIRSIVREPSRYDYILFDF